MNDGLGTRILWRLYLLYANFHKKHFPRTVANASSLTCHWSRLPKSSVFQRRRLCSVAKMLEDNIDMDLFFPKRDVRGMTMLDRSAFTKIINVPAVAVKKDIIHKTVKSLKHQLIKRPCLKRVVEDPKDVDKKLVLLDPHIFSSQDSFGANELDLLQKLDINPEIIKYDLELSYENFKTEEVLRAVLPEGQDVASGFSRVGHVAHMNLREHQLPYKYLIGQVIIDKNPGITSVVNKTNTIDTTYRNFQMEVLAGDSNMVTKVRENYINYEFDFSKVYWNPRLSTEHERIIGQLTSNDILFDVFAGVGPFAIPAAKKNCTVYANDLNPDSYKWLQHNCKLNKVDRKVQTFNMDGRDFITGPVKEQLAKLMQLGLEGKESSVHIAMNLPGLAVEFLNCFQGLLDKQPGGKVSLPIVHCYSFSKDDDPAGDIRRRAESFLGSSIEECISIHLVRNVAPNKEMMCISFRVPAGVLFGKGSAISGDSEEPLAKRLRTDGECPEERPSMNSKA